MRVAFASEEYGQEEIDAVKGVLEKGWLASGEHNIEFEKEFAKVIGTKDAVCVNSGSMANLIALQSLNLPPGSRVLTSACGFPATLSPILHLGLEPVLVDYDLVTHNIDVDQAIKLLGSVSAVIFAHTLGNPVDPRLINECKRLGVPVIEDCCEAVGSSINEQACGAIGDLGTFSFYPAHQITALGSGGMITTNDTTLANRCRSLRDWGKIWNWDTKLGNNYTSFTTSVDGFPYYPGYTYETVGYNAKLAEANAAFGRVQLKSLASRATKRFENYCRLHLLFREFDEFIKHGIVLGSLPSSFGFPITFREDGWKRDKLVLYLEAHGVRTRPFFAGNITRHKPFLRYKASFPVADHLMRNSFFVGCWQGLGEEHLNHIYETVKTWLKSQ